MRHPSSSVMLCGSNLFWLRGESDDGRHHWHDTKTNSPCRSTGLISFIVSRPLIAWNLLLPLTSQLEAVCNCIDGYVAEVVAYAKTNHASDQQIWWPHQSHLCGLVLSLSHALRNEQHVGVSECPLPREYTTEDFQFHRLVASRRDDILILCAKKNLSNGIT